MDELMDIILKLLAILFGVGLIYVGKLAVNWIKSKLDTQQAEKLDKIIADLVAAAEQIYKGINDEDGTGRYAYVENMLVEAGYEVTEKVRALIESNVFEINVITGSAKESGDGGN